MNARFVASVTATLVSVAAFAAPTVLILQTMAPKKGDTDVNVPIYDYIAQELDTEGRVVPIVYSITDPVFRAATQDGRLKDVPDQPSMHQVEAIAQKLNAEYVLVLGSMHEGKLLKERARLYKNGKQVWKDEQDMAVSLQDTLNSENTGRSVAHTLVLRMDVGPLKTYPNRTKNLTPDLSPGQRPETHDTTPAPPPVENDDKLKKDVAAMIASGRQQNALQMLRDAVDARPFDLDRRMDLINFLMADHPQQAAEEARRAAYLMPEKSELRALAARAWMQSGHPDEAQKDLNEAVARDPSGAGTRLMLGELSISQLEPEKAIDHLDQSVKLHDSGYARFLRALCRSMLGGVDGMQADIAAADKLEPQRTGSEDTRRYVLAADVTDRLAGKDAAAIRNLTQQIVVKPKDKALRDEIEQILRLLQSRTALLSAIKVPAENKSAHDRRVLANKLLVQCLHDLTTFGDSGDEDSLADARINLGEALKQLDSLKRQS